ncbi:class I SAM-dependent methyltransferase [bacterium]|nr:class I SAM-dependent methyltransferase [bacterium]
MQPPRSPALIKFAEIHQPHSSIVADALNLPHRPRSFDFAICIAVIHHLSTPSRRVEAVRSILELLNPGSCGEIPGRLLLFVWALEQKSSRRGWDVGDEQDVMVPWVLKDNTKGTAGHGQDSEYHRYYHLYREGELESDTVAAGGTILESGYERDNWWAICVPTS